MFTILRSAHSLQKTSANFHAIMSLVNRRKSNIFNVTQNVERSSGIRKAVRHARMAHKATKWPIKKILTGPVMRPDRTKLVK